MGRIITITEIDNGWLVDEFSKDGSSSLDKVLFLETFSKVLEEITAWKQLVDEEDEA